eukprot:6962790-Pyramimonas_sp.AAC.1
MTTANSRRLNRSLQGRSQGKARHQASPNVWLSAATNTCLPEPVRAHHLRHKPYGGSTMQSAGGLMSRAALKRRPRAAGPTNHCEPLASVCTSCPTHEVRGHNDASTGEVVAWAASLRHDVRRDLDREG